MKISFSIATLVCSLWVLPFIAFPANAASTVPFVGCSASGLQEVPAPSGDPVELNFPPNVAAKLALYAGAYDAVLAPRGWNCSGGVGSDAISLSIVPPTSSPHAGDSSITIRTDMEGMGSEFYDLNTIGRTYFPKLVNAESFKSFLVECKRRGFNVAPVPAPRYPSDRLTYLSQSAFEYETPQGKDGIAKWINGGTSPFAQYGIISVQGKYVPDGNEDDRVVRFINVNLPPDLAYLTKFILAASRPCMLDYDAASCKMRVGITYPDQ